MPRADHSIPPCSGHPKGSRLRAVNTMSVLHANCNHASARFARALVKAALNVKLRLEHEQGRH